MVEIVARMVFDEGQRCDFRQVHTGFPHNVVADVAVFDIVFNLNWRREWFSFGEECASFCFCLLIICFCVRACFGIVDSAQLVQCVHVPMRGAHLRMCCGISKCLFASMPQRDGEPQRVRRSAHSF